MTEMSKDHHLKKIHTQTFSIQIVKVELSNETYVLLFKVKFWRRENFF